MINLSLGGLRDPRDPDRDTFSPLEAAAVAYAYGKGVVVVAAVGNAEQGATKPWPYASYPAALPHVLGVSALARDGSVPRFSNRDKIYNDIAAPGAGIISTMPLEMTAPFKECLDQGLLELRAGGVAQGRGDVLRRSAGRRPPPRSSSRVRPEPASRAGDGAADRDRRGT